MQLEVPHQSEAGSRLSPGNLETLALHKAKTIHKNTSAFWEFRVPNCSASGWQAQPKQEILARWEPKWRQQSPGHPWPCSRSSFAVLALPAEQQHPLDIYSSSWLLLSPVPLLPITQIPFFPPTELRIILPFAILFLILKICSAFLAGTQSITFKLLQKGFLGKGSSSRRFSLEYSDGGHLFPLLSIHLQIPERFC